MDPGGISAVLVMSDVAVQCTIMARGKRLVDCLNDRESDFLSVTDLRVFRCDGAVPTIVTGDGVVWKRRVQMALLVDQSKQSKSLFFATVERRQIRSTIVMTRAVITGTLHARIAKDARSFLTVDAGPYFAVTGATIHDSAVAQELKVPVALIGKDHVAALSLHAPDSLRSADEK